MGASVSLMNIPDQPALSSQIQEEYADLVETDMSLEEIEQHLSVKYSSKVKRSTKNVELEQILSDNAEPPSLVVQSNCDQYEIQIESTKGKQQSNKSKALNNKQVCGKSKAGTRRRSYGEENLPDSYKGENNDSNISPPLPSTPPTIVNPAVPTNTTDTANTPNTTDLKEQDSWSSVVQQPSCPLCQMTFATESKLERHIKYSTLHATSLQKMREKENAAEAARLEEDNPRPPTPQEEGVHFKQLYSGDKYFWRTKANLEIRMFLHIDLQVIEIAAYDKNHNSATNRPYLNYDVLLHVIDDVAMRAVEQRKAEIKEKQKNARKKGTEYCEIIPSDEVMLAEAKRVVLVSHILDRLQIDLTNGKDKPHISYLPIVKIDSNDQKSELENENDTSSPASKTENKYCESKILLSDPPLKLKPVHVSWRRYSSIDECVAVRNDLESGIKELTVASDRASKLTELIFAATSGLGAIAKRNQKMRDMGYSKWRMKWIWAIRRVIIQADVAKNTARLKQMGYE